MLPGVLMLLVHGDSLSSKDLEELTSEIRERLSLNLPGKDIPGRRMCKNTKGIGLTKKFI